MIAYYAHQHGSGHSNYAQLFALQKPDYFIVFTSYAFNFQHNLRFIQLPSEDPDGTEAPQGVVDMPGYLHYSPVGQRSIQQRSATLLNTCVEENVKLIIIDVSVEIAALARAASFPYAYVRLPGKRDDTAHMEAFRGAVVLLAYFPEALEDEDTPQWIRKKTRYLGFFSRFKIKPHQIGLKAIKKIVIISGGGGNKNLQALLPHILKRFENKIVDVFGEFEQIDFPENVSTHGYRQDILEYVEQADVVVANCGLNTISELLHLGKIILALPEERPYNEQEILYKKLVEHRLVCPADYAIKATDQEIMERTADPSNFLNTASVKEFVNKLVQTNAI